MSDSKTERMEAIMEAKGLVLDMDKGQEALEELAAYIKHTFMRLEEEGILKDMNMDFSAFILTNVPEDDVVVNADTDVFMVPQQVIHNMGDLYTTQKQTVNIDLFKRDDYMRGMFNGMEVLMSTLEDREPMFLGESGQYYTPGGFKK